MRGDDGMFDCVDCGVNTWEIREYYMVIDKVWDCHGCDTGMLCIGCLEKRMGRKLCVWDFRDVPINWDSRHSDRLENRLWGSLSPVGRELRRLEMRRLKRAN